MAPVTTRLPPKLTQEVKREAKVRGMKLYAVFEEALRMWLATKKAA